MPNREGSGGPWSDEKKGKKEKGFIQRNMGKLAAGAAVLGLGVGAERLSNTREGTQSQQAADKVLKQEPAENEPPAALENVAVPPVPAQVSPEVKINEATPAYLSNKDLEDEDVPTEEELIAEDQAEGEVMESLLGEALGDWKLDSQGGISYHDEIGRLFVVSPKGESGGHPFRIIAFEDGTYLINYSDWPGPYHLESDMLANTPKDLQRIVGVKTSPEFNKILDDYAAGQINWKETDAFFEKNGITRYVSANDLRYSGSPKRDN